MNQATLASEMSKLKTPFINRNYLELAMLVCNTFRGKLFPCPHCRYVTDRRNNLKRHVATMHQACDKVLECCGVHFNTKASLREHIMIFHHNGYSCPYCGRRFCRKALLKRHLSVHSGQKDYTCPHCDYATSHKSNLERHKRIHERIKMIDEDGNLIESPADGASPSHFLPDTTMSAGSDVGHIDVDDDDDDLCEIVDDVDDDLSSSDFDSEDICQREHERRMRLLNFQRPLPELGDDNSGPMDCSMKTSLLGRQTATVASSAMSEAMGKPEDLSMCKEKPATVSASSENSTVTSARDSVSAQGSERKTPL